VPFASELEEEMSDTRSASEKNCLADCR